MKRSSIAALGALLVAAFATLACSTGGTGGKGIGASACEGVAGSYLAQFRSTCVSFGVIAVTLNQSGCHLSGSSASATIEGDMNGDAAVFRITFLGTCPGTAIGTATLIGQTASGSFQGTPSPGSKCCNGEISGTFTMAR